MTTKMTSIPIPIYCRFLMKFNGSKESFGAAVNAKIFISYLPYENRFRMMPPAMTEAI